MDFKVDSGCAEQTANLCNLMPHWQQRQKNQCGQQDFGHLERAGQRRVEYVAANNVDAGDQHEAEQGQRSAETDRPLQQWPDVEPPAIGGLGFEALAQLFHGLERYAGLRPQSFQRGGTVIAVFADGF